MKLKEVSEKIFEEISYVQEHIVEAEVLEFIQAILQASHIIVYGVGRMGLISRAFVMRLMHLGFHAYFLGETTTPSVGPDDLLLITSGSGETRTVVEVAKLGKSRGVRLATITCNPMSTIAKLADIIVTMPDLVNMSKTDQKSIQPMKTTVEQNLLILLDAIVILIMDRTNQTSEDLWGRHSNLE